MDQTKRSIELALNVQDRLISTHTRIGDFKRSTGRIFAIYARSSKLLQAQYNNQDAVYQFYLNLKKEVIEATKDYLDEANRIGGYYFTNTADIWEIAYEDLPNVSGIYNTSVAGIESLIDKQYQLFIGLLLAGELNPEIFFGLSGSGGVMTPKPIITSLKTFTANLVNSFLSWFSQQTGLGFMAVAILDDLTSPCCRAVDGQVQPIGTPFELTAPPHYASEMIKPPFHDGCRTTRALVSL